MDLEVWFVTILATDEQGSKRVFDGEVMEPWELEACLERCHELLEHPPYDLEHCPGDFFAGIAMDTVSPGEFWRGEMRELLLEVYLAEPEHFRERWIPLLERYPSHWRHPLKKVWFRGGPFQLSELTDALPFARFTLDASSTQISRRILASLEQAPWVLTPFTHINLHDNFLGTEGMVSLAVNEGLAGTTHLMLSGTCIDSEAIEALLRSPHLRQLQVLYLNDNRICDRGAMMLASAPELSNLELLDLSNNPISEDGYQALAAAGRLSR